MESLLQSLLAGLDPAWVSELYLPYELTSQYQAAQLRRIGGLEPYINLENLNLSAHSLSSLEGLPTLARLRRLDLSYNQLEDLDTLLPQPSLTELDVSYNELSRLEGLDAQETLQELNISHNHLTDLGPIAGLSRLELLAISGNRLVRDLQPLASLRGLTRLYVKGLRIMDWTPVASLEALQGLYLTPLQLPTLLPLTRLTALATLHVSLNRIQGIAEMPAFGGVRRLTLARGLGVTHIHGLEVCGSLQHLDISHNALQALPALAPGLVLTQLSVRNNQIRDLSPLMTLGGLSALRLGGNPVPAEQIEAVRAAFPGIRIF